MKTKLTLRFILMVILSTTLLLGFTFLFSAMYEDILREDFLPANFAYNFADAFQVDAEEEITLTDQGQADLLKHNAWVQFLSEEGYVLAAFNEPSYVSNHYSPVEIDHMSISDPYNQGYIFYTGKNNENLNYLLAIPSENWNRVTLEFNDELVIQFFQILMAVATIIFLVMGYFFSRRIAEPVSQIVGGVETLANGYYTSEFKERGLYKPVYKSINQLSTRLKASELERKKTKSQREKWISNISHDLKTPLSTIKGYSEILSDSDYELSKEETKRYAKKIHDKSIYMENMIAELRLNEQLIDEGLRIEKKEGNLTTFIKEVVIDILNHPEYSKRDILFEATDEIIIYSFNENLLKRSLENLIYNALIHNEQRTVVTVKVTRLKGNIILTIQDNGQGMNEEELEQLFNRYYRGSNTKSYKGSGLGMSIAKEVIEAHGGRITVQSVKNIGTEITITL